MNQSTFPVTIVVLPPESKPSLRTYDIRIDRLIFESGGNVVRYIQDYEDPPFEWFFADDDDKEDYA